MLNNILRALAPLLLSATLMLAWVILVATLVILWLVGKFRDGRVTTGVVTLLALVILPLSSWLLGRSFFRTGIFAGVESSGLAAISENIGSVLENSRKPAGPVEPEEPSGSASVEPVSSPAPDVPTDPNARKPEDYTDEELLKLAEENFRDMFLTDIAYINHDLLPTDFNDVITITFQDPDIGRCEWPYGRVVGYTDLDEVETALNELWYSKFSHKYPIDPLWGYIPFNGGIYARDGAMGGPASLIVDRITSRDDEEVVFIGYYHNGTQVYGVMEFSFVYEDGRWKYGYVKSLPEEEWPASYATL